MISREQLRARTFGHPSGVELCERTFRTGFVPTIIVGGLFGCSHPLAPPAGKASETRPESGCFGGPVEVVQAPAGMAGIDISDRTRKERTMILEL
jgi:hypothetical protein